MTAAPRSKDQMEQVRANLCAAGLELGLLDGWDDALAEVDILGLAMRDIIGIGYVEARRGQRQVPDVTEGLARWREFIGDDYSTLPFHQAFEQLTAGLTVRDIGHRIGGSKSWVDRLRNRVITPTSDDMARIAEAFGKPPTWFHEYRVNLVAAAVAAALTDNPERSAVLAQLLVV